MFFRLTRYRLKAEWLRILLGVVFGTILLSWISSQNIVDERLRSFDGYVNYYQSQSRREARSKGLRDPDPANRSDQKEGYELLLRENRGYLYAVLIEMVNDWVPPLTVIPLAVLFLTGLFQKKRLGPMLTAGFSRGRVFLSLTGAYFVCIALVWGLSAAWLLNRYRIAYAPEEQVFFRVTLLTWFCAFLWHGTIAYLTAMLLRRPLPAFAAALALWFILGNITVRTPNMLPSYIIDNSENVKPLLPGIDLWPLLRTDIVAAGSFVISILVSWLAFRKRGLE